MNILVLMKAVAANTGGYAGANRLATELIPNPADISSLEEALKLKDSLGGTVDVLSMGPLSVESMLTDAVSRGADQAFLLSDPAFAGADTAATSRALAAAIKKLGSYDLIICGKKTTDGETGQVGPELAVRLGIDCITDCCALNADSALINCICNTDDGIKTVEAAFPLLVTVRYGINSPRLPSIMGLRRAKKTEIKRLALKDVDIAPEQCGLKGSPTQVLSSCVKPFEKRHPVFYDASSMSEAARSLLTFAGGTDNG